MADGGRLSLSLALLQPTNEKKERVVVELRSKTSAMAAPFPVWLAKRRAKQFETASSGESWHRLGLLLLLAHPRIPNKFEKEENLFFNPTPFSLVKGRRRVSFLIRTRNATCRFLSVCRLSLSRKNRKKKSCWWWWWGGGREVGDMSLQTTTGKKGGGNVLLGEELGQGARREGQCLRRLLLLLFLSIRERERIVELLLLLLPSTVSA